MVVAGRVFKYSYTSEEEGFLLTKSGFIISTKRKEISVWFLCEAHALIDDPLSQIAALNSPKS